MIVLAHGPVAEVEDRGNGKYLFALEDGTEYSIKFIVSDGMCRRLVRTGEAEYEDGFELWGDMEEEDCAQWTADNWCEIEELIGSEGSEVEE